jgi:hypothetical protein
MFEEIDIDEEDSFVEVGIEAQHGRVSLVSDANISFTSGQADQKMLLFTGMLLDINAALSSMVYTPQAGYKGDDRIRIVVKDKAFSAKELFVTLKADSNKHAQNPFLGLTITDPNAPTARVLFTIYGDSLSLGTTNAIVVGKDANTQSHFAGRVLSAFRPRSNDLSFTLTPLVDEKSGGFDTNSPIPLLAACLHNDPQQHIDVMIGCEFGSIFVDISEGAEFFNSDNGSKAIHLVGTIKALNKTLETISYKRDAEHTGADRLAVVMNDSNKDYSRNLFMRVIPTALAPQVSVDSDLILIDSHALDDLSDKDLGRTDVSEVSAVSTEQSVLRLQGLPLILTDNDSPRLSLTLSTNYGSLDVVCKESVSHHVRGNEHVFMGTCNQLNDMLPTLVYIWEGVIKKNQTTLVDEIKYKVNDHEHIVEGVIKLHRP